MRAVITSDNHPVNGQSVSPLAIFPILYFKIIRAVTMDGRTFLPSGFTLWYLSVTCVKDGVVIGYVCWRRKRDKEWVMGVCNPSKFRAGTIGFMQA
jgi:hypothetical protein